MFVTIQHQVGHGVNIVTAIMKSGVIGKIKRINGNLEMRQDSNYLEEIKDLDIIIETTKKLIPEFPEDKLLPLNIEQCEKRKKYLLKQYSPDSLEINEYEKKR